MNRKTSSLILKAFGWTVDGGLPPEDKCIILGAPHTTILDFVLAYLYYKSLGGTAVCMVKKEIFRTPLGPFVRKAHKKDVFLSVLPIAHTYELSIGMLYPFACGAKVWYLNSVPTPTVLAKAFARIRPTVMLSVPLIQHKRHQRVSRNREGGTSDGNGKIR